jgi:hypothetical protein
VWVCVCVCVCVCACVRACGCARVDVRACVGRSHTPRAPCTIAIGGLLLGETLSGNDAVRLRLRQGEQFFGWQKQKAHNGREFRTIEDTLETALGAALGQAVRFFPAGRTDAGVSAAGQCITFDAMLAPSSPGSSPLQAYCACTRTLRARHRCLRHSPQLSDPSV